MLISSYKYHFLVRLSSRKVVCAVMELSVHYKWRFFLFLLSLCFTYFSPCQFFRFLKKQNKRCIEFPEMARKSTWKLLKACVDPEQGPPSVPAECLFNGAILFFGWLRTRTLWENLVLEFGQGLFLFLLPCERKIWHISVRVFFYLLDSTTNSDLFYNLP